MTNFSPFSPLAIDCVSSYIYSVDQDLLAVRLITEAPLASPPHPTPARVKLTIRKMLQTKWTEEWEQATQGQQTRDFFPTPSFSHVRLSNLPRQLTQILTRHSWLNAHQHRLKFKNSPFCICSNNPEIGFFFTVLCKMSIVCVLKNYVKKN